MVNIYLYKMTHFPHRHIEQVGDKYKWDSVAEFFFPEALLCGTRNSSSLINFTSAAGVLAGTYCEQVGDASICSEGCI